MIYTTEIFEEYEFSKFDQPIHSKSYNDSFIDWQIEMKKKSKNFKVINVERIHNNFASGIFVVYEK